MKKRSLTILVLAAILVMAVVLLASCSDDRKVVNYQTHADGWNEPASSVFHGRTLMSSPVFYDGCRDCHGGDYQGGQSGVSCTSCHATGPQSCATCHGVPPVSDSELLYGMDPGAAGAHAKHARFACRECHLPVNDLSHMGPLPAEVSFVSAALARKAPFANPTFSHSGSSTSGNGNCASNYCHSNGRGGAPQTIPEWVGGQTTCGICHLSPPPAPHPQDSQCHRCHDHVDPQSVYPDSIRFTNEALHVNGFVDG